jgi:hypothetical protein
MAMYSRFPVQRLDAELIRDRMLAAAGVLDRRLHGPAIAMTVDAVGQVIAENDSPRRSVYLEVQRTKPLSLLAAFDAAQPAPNCDRRVTSTTAPQALMLMNSDFVLKRAGEFAARVRRETPADFAGDLASKAPPSRRPADAWRFGYGAIDDASQRVTAFTELPHFTGGAWQGGATLPDAKLGWVILHGGGGHTGDNPGFAAIRRWTAPAAGKLAVTGKLHHPSEHGDGVRGRIVSSRAGVVGTWTAKTNEQATNVASIDVQAGDTIDFVADCNTNVNSDSFNWVVDLTLTGEGGRSAAWNSAADFHGPLVPLPRQVAYAWSVAYLRPITSGELERAMQFIAAQLDTMESQKAKGDRELTALTNLCQQLLSSNEFLYVD